MPDRTLLKPGDRIRMVSLPAGDLAQRDYETAQRLPDAGWTANTIQRIIDDKLVLTIYEIDEYGNPWFEAHFTSAEDSSHLHILAVLDDESWEPVTD